MKGKGRKERVKYMVVVGKYALIVSTLKSKQISTYNVAY